MLTVLTVEQGYVQRKQFILRVSLYMVIITIVETEIPRENGIA